MLLFMHIPNAWFYYVFPLVVGIAFVLAGWTLFSRFARGTRNANGKKYGQDAGCGGVLFMIIGGTLGLALLITSPAPWTRQRLFNHVFHTPPDRIERIVILPDDGDRPLTRSEVTIDDPARIRGIAAALSSARDISLRVRAKITCTIFLEYWPTSFF
ncbi:MAG TPA: hypothetical protein VGV35_17185 [Bryobacteraceae bacterium]|nr:hypothetical protein [Bryobacteraceae bacterium]